MGFADQRGDGGALRAFFGHCLAAGRVHHRIYRLFCDPQLRGGFAGVRHPPAEVPLFSQGRRWRGAVFTAAYLLLLEMGFPVLIINVLQSIGMGYTSRQRSDSMRCIRLGAPVVFRAQKSRNLVVAAVEI